MPQKRPGQALWMLAACLAFALMGACVKVASQSFNSAELVAWRGIISGALVYAFARSRGTRMHTRVPLMHAWRSGVGVLSLGTWFYAIAHLPLATAMTLNYMSSLWMATFVVGGSLMLVLRPGASPMGADAIASSQIGTAQNTEIAQQFSAVMRKNAPILLTLLGGFLGVVLVLRPSVGPEQGFAALMGLVSGLGAAFAYMQVIALAHVGEPEERTVFFFAVACAVVGVLCMPFTGTSPWPGFAKAAWLLPIGLFASIGQWAMTRAYASGATLLVANLQYSGVAISALLGIVLFNEVLPWYAWLGMVLVVASAALATLLRSRSG